MGSEESLCIIWVTERADTDWDDWDTVVVDDKGQVQNSNDGRRKSKKNSKSSVVIVDPLGEGADVDWEGWDEVTVEPDGRVATASYDSRSGNRSASRNSSVVIVDPKGEY